MQVYIAPLRLRTYLPQEAVVEVVGDAGGGDEGADEEGERQHEGQDERVGAGRPARAHHHQAPPPPAPSHRPRGGPPGAGRRGAGAETHRHRETSDEAPRHGGDSDFRAGLARLRGGLPLAAQRRASCPAAFACLPYPLLLQPLATCHLPLGGVLGPFRHQKQSVWKWSAHVRTISLCWWWATKIKGQIMDRLCCVTQWAETNY